jgi:hypothetical protein
MEKIMNRKIKIEDFMDKINLIFGTLPFCSWTMLTTWLHLGAIQKLQENEFTNHFEH